MSPALIIVIAIAAVVVVALLILIARQLRQRSRRARSHRHARKAAILRERADQQREEAEREGARAGELDPDRG